MSFGTPNLSESYEADKSFQDEEETMTAAELLEKLEEAWINEKFAPDLLPPRAEIIECMLEQIQQMEANLQRLNKGDFRLTAHKMELDRIKYVLSSYLRTRLEKIEKFAVHLLEQEKQRTEDQESRMTPEEFQLAKSYFSSIEEHFQNVVIQHFPKNVQKLNPSQIALKPNVNTYLFFKVKQTTNGVLIEDESGEGRDEEIDLEKDSQHIMCYHPVSHLLQSEAIQLL